MLSRKEQNKIYERYKPHMIAYCKKLYIRYDAEIIYDNTMYSVFTKIDQFQGELHSDQFDIWVWQILKNKIIDQIRMHKRYYQNIISVEEYTSDRGYIDQHESFIYSEYIPKLIQFLPSQKHINIFTDFIEGYKYKDLVKKYNIAEGTLKWFVFDSRRIIKEKIQLSQWMSKY